jgi:gamma-glutamyltranspeptidase
MADREAYFGDPDFVEAPIEGLLDTEYAASRRRAMTERVFGEMPPAGNPMGFETAAASKQRARGNPNVAPRGGPRCHGYPSNVDTSYLVVTDIQQAIAAPRFRSRNFPDSFSPHEYRRGVVALEEGLYESVGTDLEATGYETDVVDDWHHEMGAVCAIIRDPSAAGLTAGADPRQESWAAGR